MSGSSSPGRVQTIKNVLVVGSGGMIAQGLVVLANPVLTRLYEPGSYGDWGILISIALIPATVATLRLELAIVLPKSDEEAAGVFGLSVLLSLVTALLVAVVLLLGMDLITEWLGLASLESWLWTTPFLVFAFGVYQTSIGWLNRQEDFSRFSLALIVLPLGTVLVQVAAALTGMRGPGGLMLGSVIGQVAATLLLGSIVLGKYGKLLATGWSRRSMLSALSRFRSYPLFMTPCSLVNVLRNRVAVFALGAFATKGAAGHFHFSEKVIRLPGNLVSDAIRPVFFQKASVCDIRELEAPLLRGLAFINKLTLPCFVLFWCEAPQLFAWIFGEEWREASRYALILSVPAFVLLHSNWMDRGLDVLGRQKLAFQLEALFSVVSIGLLFTGLVLTGDILWGILLMAGGFLAYNVAWLVIFFRVAGFSAGGLIRLSSYTVFGGAIWASIYLLGRLALPVAASVAIYCALLTVYVLLVARTEWRAMRAGEQPEEVRGKASESEVLSV